MRFPFLRLMSGTLSREAFLCRYVAFYQHFPEIGRSLTARLCSVFPGAEFPPSTSQAGDLYDVDSDHKRVAYLFDLNSPDETAAHRCPEVVYGNENAVINAFRTPAAGLSLAP